jgi:hypothetical protein
MTSTSTTATSSPDRIPDTPVTASSHLGHLHQLLDRELAFEVGARHGFNNHLPMMLTAAAGLGASPDQLDVLFDATTDHDDYLIARETPEWLHAETDDVRRHGIHAVVAERSARLVDSPNTHWFHAPIRLEYGIEAGHPGQVANALHDWAEHRRPLPGVGEPTDGAPTSTARLADVAESLLGRAGSSIESIAGEPWFRAALAGTDLRDDPLDAARELALAAHIAGDNIATLHLVTGTRAARTIAGLLTPSAADRLGRHIAQAVAAGYVANGSPLPTTRQLDQLRGEASRAPDWGEIGHAALATGDAHVIKLAYTCLRESELTDSDLYRWVAARGAGLVDHHR